MADRNSSCAHPPTAIAYGAALFLIFALIGLSCEPKPVEAQRPADCFYGDLPYPARFEIGEGGHLLVDCSWIWDYELLSEMLRLYARRSSA